jgi:hypothetical protein
MVHRATIAGTDGPDPFKKVPAGHRREVERALNIISGKLKNKQCQGYFEDKCTPGAVETARKLFDAATVYFTPGRTEFGLSEGKNIGYNEKTFKAGHWNIAATLLHELFHTCDQIKDDTAEILAEGATEACGFYWPTLSHADPDEVYVGDTFTVKGMLLGPKNDANHYIEMGGVRITSYDKWEQPPGEKSSTVVEFKVPETMVRPGGGDKKVAVVAVNHGFKSEPKIVIVARKPE